MWLKKALLLCTVNREREKERDPPGILLLNCWYGDCIELMGCGWNPSLFIIPPGSLPGGCPGYIGAEGGPEYPPDGTCP